MVTVDKDDAGTTFTVEYVEAGTTVTVDNDDAGTTEIVVNEEAGPTVTVVSDEAGNTEIEDRAGEGRMEALDELRAVLAVADESLNK